jgi:phosphate-selective porin OprO/OprP
MCYASEGDKSDYFVATRGGLEIASYDGQYSFELGGRLMLDAAFYHEDKADLGDGAEVRRAYLEMGGTFLGDWEYEVDIDFSQEDSDLKDAYIAYAGISPLLFRAGHFKEPFGLESLTSSKNITFMERALLDELTPGRNLGLGAMFSGARCTASAGFFGQGATEDVKDEGDEGWGLTGRLTYAPVLSETRLVHLGASGSFRKVDDEGETKFDAGPESHVTEMEFLDTGKIKDVDSLARHGFEAAGVFGPLSLQGEWVETRLNRKEEGQDYEFAGYYLSGSWFITGESRAYIPETGVFGRIKPKSKKGALEAALRYSALDLSHRDITGGKEKNLTAGLNWYLNPHIRLSANYIQVDNDEDADANGDVQGGDDPCIFQTRFQLAF